MISDLVTTTPNPWMRIQGALEKKLNRHVFDTWFKPARFSHDADGKLFVAVPSAEFCTIGERYNDLILEAIDNLGLFYDDIEFVPAPAEPPGPVMVRHNGALAPAPVRPPAQTRFDFDGAAQLNPRYIFSGFVIGSGNQFAHAAAMAVASAPGKAYNPLFLYGGVGMGKTHLMQAIGHEIKLRQPDSSIVYLSAERFTNEMINSIKHDRMVTFRDRFRGVDVLLIDDIQFLAQKERTQEEFFHTFNALHDSNRQIVIASDRSPKELSDVDDRLRSRFEWGLIADIQPPDLETKIAILQKKAESDSITLPDDVCQFIASNIRSNVRELEGALIRLIAYGSLTGAAINLTTAQQVLKNIIDQQSRKVTIEAIQKAVTDQFGLRLPEIKVKNNSRQIVFPRQIAMYLCKHLTEASLPEIGRQFGGKHHTTVLHSIGKINLQRKDNKDLNRMLNKLTEQLSN